MKRKIEVITYKQDRLSFFTDLMQKSQKKYTRLFKKYKDNSYLSEEAQILSDAGRETHFFGDVVEMLEKDYHKQEWISIDDRLPKESCVCLVATHFGAVYLISYSHKYKAFNATDTNDEYAMHSVTHWMPLPEAPKMKGGAE